MSNFKEKQKRLSFSCDFRTLTNNSENSRTTIKISNSPLNISIDCGEITSNDLGTGVNVIYAYGPDDISFEDRSIKIFQIPIVGLHLTDISSGVVSMRGILCANNYSLSFLLDPNFNPYVGAIPDENGQFHATEDGRAPKENIDLYNAYVGANVTIVISPQR